MTAAGAQRCRNSVGSITPMAGSYLVGTGMRTLRPGCSPGRGHNGLSKQPKT
jgi:hypothetical protein